jgi:nitrogen fixation protein NifU and related proteins
MDIYRETILEHYKNPRNFGHLTHPDSTVEEGNITCGDRIVMEIQVKHQKSKVRCIQDIRFSGEGCAISQAAASMLTEKAKGMSLTEVLSLQTSAILSMLGTTLTPSRTKCATLPLEVLQKAVSKLLP